MNMEEFSPAAEIPVLILFPHSSTLETRHEPDKHA